MSFLHDPPLVMAVMPAYNAARTLESIHGAIPPGAVGEVLLVDDGSTDETINIARTLPITIISLPHNVGYGGNQKVCCLEALQREADVVVMLHPDGQYDPAVIPDLVAPILDGTADLVLGSRMLVPGQARSGGMPLYRFVANKLLTAVENAALGTSASELHTGYRAYSQEFLKIVPFLRNSNNFVFDTQLIAQAIAFSQRLVEVPISTRYHPQASSTSWKANLGYGCATLFTMLRWRLHKAGIVKCNLFRR
ncbi:MAG: glycosyltransferase family 2 protein [Actinomycetota bacterium]